MGRKRRRDKHLPPRVYRSHGAHYFVDRAGRWHHLGRDYAEAMAAYARLAPAPGALVTLADVFTRYEREVLPTKAPRTERDQRVELARLRVVFGDARPHQVTPQHVYGYMDRRPAVRANREKALLSHVFTKAIRWGVVAANPCKGVESNPERPRSRYVSDAEFWAVHDLAPAPVAVCMRLALLTGLRLADLLALRRDQATDEGILVPTGKTGRALLFVWTDELQAAVEDAKALRKVASLWLVSTRRGQPYSVDGFKAMWQRTMAKHVAQGGERFQFRDLRAKAGSDSKDGELLGHSDRRMLERHYRRAPRRVRPVAMKDRS